MSKRYVIDPTEQWAIAHLGGPDHYGTTIETRTLVDTRTGHRYPEGAYRVSSPSLPRPRIFKGETAWSDAARLANDLGVSARYAR
jgi:hypothetical protein